MSHVTRLTDYVEKEYGVGIVAAPTIAVIWAAEALVNELPVEEVKELLKKANAVREKHGKQPAYAAYGSPLF